MQYLHHLDTLIARYPALEPLRRPLAEAAAMMIHAYRHDGKLLIAGNGGSAADAEHITGELMKGFIRKRPLPAERQQRFAAFGEPGVRLAAALQCGLPALNLGMAPALLSAFGNDVSPDFAIAQHLLAVGRPGDVFLAISTGGNAENLRLALIAAQVLELPSILLTGARHGCCEALATLSIPAPERETYKIQEYHLPIYHAWCMMIEEEFYGDGE